MHECILCVKCSTALSRGSGGMLPRENLNLRCSEIASGVI